MELFGLLLVIAVMISFYTMHNSEPDDDESDNDELKTRDSNTD